MAEEQPFKLEREVFGIKVSVFDDFSFKNEKDETINVKRGIKIGIQRLTAAQLAAVKYLLNNDKELIQALQGRLEEEQALIQSARY